LTQRNEAINLAAVLVPPALKPGDRIQVVAPSSPFDHTLAWRGLGWLAERYRVKFDPDLFRRGGMFAGTDERRLAELNAALCATDVAAVLAARGGHGLLRLVADLDLTGLRDSPKWVIGFSDVTFLHNELARRGVASLHAPNLTGLGRACSRTRERLVQVLEAPLRQRVYRGLETWVTGRAEGPLAGGNLTVLMTCAAAGRLYLPSGCVLILEDVTELSYRLDRMLTSLLLGGGLQNAAAVVVGDLIDCSPGAGGVSAEAVLRERLSRLGVPVARGLPFGHGRCNEPLPLGAPAILDATAGTLVIGHEA
jgi:muramoyltetrapeptide carboxypeptidase